MANQITTAADLKAVLDAIYDNRESYDTYQTMQLYYNEITRTAKIFSVTEDDTETIVAVFNPENVVTTDNAFICTLMKSTITYGDEVQVFDLGLGGYVSVNVLIKNICASLGVLINDTFIEANPQYYNDMVAIIKNRYGRALENQAPYIMKKGIGSQTDEEYYKSYIPILCIVDIAIYLNNMGIFAQDIEKEIMQPLSSNKTYTNALNMPYMNDSENIFTLSDMGYELMSKNEFREKVYRYYKYIVDAEHYLNAFETFMNQYENDIDWSNDYVDIIWTQSLNSSTKSEGIYVVTVPFDKVFRSTNYDRYLYTHIAFNGGLYGATSTSSTRWYAAKEQSSRVTYSLTMTLDLTTPDAQPVINHSKNTYIVESGITFRNETFANEFTNLKCDKMAKYYTSYDYYHDSGYSSRQYYYVDHYPRLSSNTDYDSLQLMGDRYKHLYLDVLFMVYMRRNNITIGDNDLVFCKNSSIGSATTGDYHDPLLVYIIRDIGTVNCNFALESSTNGLCLINEYKNTSNPSYDIDYEDLRTYRPLYNTQYISYSSSITFDSEKVVDCYELLIPKTISVSTITEEVIDQYMDVYQLNGSVFNFADTHYKTTVFPSTTRIFMKNNLGEIITVGGGSEFEGLTIMDGADTPNDVIDLLSFNTHYPDWNKIISWNPTLVNGVLQDTTATTTWGAVGITKDTPTSQESEQGGEIDFDDSDVVEDIIEDTDNATEDNDKADDEPDTGSDTNGGEDTGTTPDLPERADLVTPAYIKVYALTETQANNFLTEMLDPTAWEGFESAIFGNPMQYIIGLQTTEVYNGGGTTEAITTANHTFSTQGKRISGTSDVYVDINLGDLDIEPYYDNYLDITNTTIQLYLPYIGFVDLDTALVMDKTINLSARIYLITGDLLYTLKTTYDSSQGYSATHTIYQWSGNCQEEVPLSNDGSLMKSIGRSLLSFSDKINDGILARASKSIR